MIKATSMLTAEPKRYGFSKSKLTRMAERVECFRITRELSETDRNTPAHLSAGSIYAPPCILFEYALEHYKLISETVYTVTSATFEKKKKKKYETVFGTFTYRNVPSEAFPLGIRLIQEGSRICGYNGAKHRTSAFLKMRYAALCSTHLIYCILRRQINRKLLFCRCRLIGSSDKARSMPYKSPPVFRNFPPVYLLDCGKGGIFRKNAKKKRYFR